MTNIEKYDQAFIDIFGVSKEMLDQQFCKENVENWDSVHQLSVVTAIEDSFSLFFEPEDIMSFVSYEAGKKIVENYNISFD